MILWHEPRRPICSPASWPQAEETNPRDNIASTIPSKKLKTNLCANIVLSTTKETHLLASIIASFISSSLIYFLILKINLHQLSFVTSPQDSIEPVICTTTESVQQEIYSKTYYPASYLNWSVYVISAADVTQANFNGYHIVSVNSDKRFQDEENVRKDRPGEEEKQRRRTVLLLLAVRVTRER